MRKALTSDKLVLKKQLWGIIGILFGGAGVAMFSFHELLWPRLLAWCVFLIGVVDVFRYYKVEFDRESRTYYLRKGWRFPHITTSTKQGYFNDFSFLVVQLQGPDAPSSYFHIILEYKNGSPFVPYLSMCRASSVKVLVDELRDYADFFGLKVELRNIPERYRQSFSEING